MTKSPIKAIRAYCLDCSDGSAHEVRTCYLEDCPLWHFRFGKNPFTTRTISPSHLAKLHEGQVSKANG